MITKVLIANRGEIAVRVARSCRELGVPVALACSAADVDSLAARMVDETVVIGPGPAKASYLNIPAMIEACRRVGADAVHPGYGFLAENPDFAQVCRATGITFIGPPPEVMARFGDKVQARALMSAAGVPLLPGSNGPLIGPADAACQAEEIGYPVIIKASAGGGGRGMRVVSDQADLGRALSETRAAAQALFGDGTVYLERFLSSARHVEVQVFCDAHGAGITLGERDCTVQRRHQKLIEESPAPGLPPELTRRIARTALRGVLAGGYQGAGTVEFLVDAAQRFYFMEVNCRIQVEHPVTEMTTGFDLVAEQIRVAGGAPLSVTQEAVVPRGAAIECRINTEDPSRGFVPTPGTLTGFSVPGGPFVRVDTHAYPGYRIPAHYDSLLAKLVVWAPDRAAAIDRMRRVLREVDVRGVGVTTNRDFLDQVLDSQPFRDAEHDTGLVSHLLAE